MHTRHIWLNKWNSFYKIATTLIGAKNQIDQGVKVKVCTQLLNSLIKRHNAVVHCGPYKMA